MVDEGTAESFCRNLGKYAETTVFAVIARSEATWQSVLLQERFPFADTSGEKERIATTSVRYFARNDIVNRICTISPLLSANPQHSAAQTVREKRSLQSVHHRTRPVGAIRQFSGGSGGFNRFVIHSYPFVLDFSLPGGNI